MEEQRSVTINDVAGKPTYKLTRSFVPFDNGTDGGFEVQITKLGFRQRRVPLLELELAVAALRPTGIDAPG